MESAIEKHRDATWVGYLAVVLATACWGTSGVFVKFMAQSMEIEALPLAFWRDLGTFVVLFVGLALLQPNWLRVTRQELVWLVGAGASIGVFHVLWNLAVLLNGAAVATVQQAVMPAIVAVVAWIIWREPLTWIKILAILLAFIGTVFVSGLDVLGEVELSLDGFLIGLLLPFFYACCNLFNKKARQYCNALTILTYAFGFGALVLLPFQFFVPQTWPVPAAAWGGFAGMIGVATIIPWGMYTFGLGRLPASVASILSMLEIPIVALYAYVLLDERLTTSQIIGSVLVILGLLLLFRRQKK